MSSWVVWLSGAAVVWVPGIVIRALAGRRSTDGIAAAGESAAIGIAFWPIVFLLSSSANARWNSFPVAAAMTLLTAACVVMLIRQRARLFRRPHALTLVGGALLAIVVGTRLAHVGGIALPLWVDSVHHTMIVRLLLDRGTLPSTYEPFIADSTFYYHWGFHALTAVVAWLSGMTRGDEVARLLLAFGQFLNVLTFPAVYCGAKALFRSRRTALLAATLATLVSFFPAYYVSWGRYTQLCGLLLLPVAAALFRETGRQRRLSSFVPLTIVACGMLLIHVRVATVFAMLALVLVMLLALQRNWRGLAWCGTAAVLSLALASPWLLRLASTPQVTTLLAPRADQTARWETSSSVPPDLMWAPNNLALLTLATAGVGALTPLPGIGRDLRIAGVLWWLALVVLLEKKRREKDRPVHRFDGWRFSVVAAWVLLTFLMTNAELFGLPRVRIVPNSATIIMLFLPLSLAGGHLIRWAIDAVARSPLRRRMLTTIAALIIAGAGTMTMLQIINPVTVLATDADRHALEWIRRTTPADARFAVGVQPWIGGSYIGNDGGYWIPVLTDRSSILPPGLYSWVMSPPAADSTAAQLDRWFRAQRSGDPGILHELRSDGVRYVYFGTRNETPLRAVLASSPALTRVYSSGGVDIYRIR